MSLLELILTVVVWTLVVFVFFYYRSVALKKPNVQKPMNQIPEENYPASHYRYENGKNTEVMTTFTQHHRPSFAKTSQNINHHA
jgi:hypothetical protein